MHERRHKKLILKRADLPTATEAGDDIASEVTINNSSVFSRLFFRSSDVRQQVFLWKGK